MVIMKILIIGGAGFVGNHLINHLLANEHWQISVTKMPHEKITRDHISIYDLDILNEQDILRLLIVVKPDYIFHLAAQSSVSLSWDKPDLTVDINIKGCINLLNAIRNLDYRPRTLLIGSGEEYGHIHTDETPIHEEVLPRPGNIYAVTKVCQNMIGQIYTAAYQMDIITVRAFNHIGPNQSPQFVVADFCKQVAQIEQGLKEPVLIVGNLQAKRDFTDVRDVVHAYCLLMEKGKSGELYNVGSGKALEIQELLNLILSMSKKDIAVTVDPNKLRPIDISIIEADISKLKAATKWKPNIPIKQTILETLEFWRKTIQSK